MSVVATAGHVDHGKSSLVLALTGTDPDRFAEEKRRGLTIDLGFAHTILPSGRSLSFVDVPGHVRFLKNMLAGAGAVDRCLFVVAASEGWKPQSEEHLRILDVLGVGEGVVALTKVDLVDDDVVVERQVEIAGRVAGTFLAGAPVVPVAAPVGRGLAELLTALDHLVDGAGPVADRARPRLWVDRVFASRGAGTVVTGTSLDGTFAVGDAVEVGHRRRPARIRGIQNHGEPVERIGPGERAALNLRGIEVGDVARGDAVVWPGTYRPCTVADATLNVLDSLDHDVSRRGAHVAYIGSGEHPVRARLIGTRAIEPGDTGTVRLHLPVALPLLPGDRYVLRESGRNETVGGGEILDVAPVRTAARARPDRSIDRVIAERGFVDADELELITGQRRAPTIGRWVADPAALAELLSALQMRVNAAGAVGLDTAGLDERDRAALVHLTNVVVANGRARPADAADLLAEHPFLAALRAGGCAPPEPIGVDRGELRALVQRGDVVERDGIYFHTEAIDAAARVAATLLQSRADGFTVAELRDALGITRKYALPIVNELDGRGVTRRRGDRRIAGPRLPPV
ncbi:MAG: selenocysteine-specific elongation factor [Acidimicrobiaceae bacterium]|nr:selenocysteine-specific elongation factor [Acidimicrobiaceae bacterium]